MRSLLQVTPLMGAKSGVDSQSSAVFPMSGCHECSNCADDHCGVHAHARARWTGRTLRVEIEGWVEPDLTARDADALGRLVAEEVSRQLPQAGSLSWTTRAAPV